ncbi:MAG: FtsQ-type POTRA domain-containing protein [Enterobacterales bacterium]|nr:FtsQ-type POTRA domain-containing protein [Enterobacterales bacterium]
MAIKKVSENRASSGLMDNFIWLKAFKSWILLAVFLGVFFVLGKGLSDYYAQVWPVKTIAFTESMKHVEKQQIAKVLKQQKVTGLLAIDLRLLQKTILEIAWVKSVRIEKKWPKTLVFSIQEYQPIASVNGRYLMENGDLLLEKIINEKQKLMQLFYENMEQQPSNWLNLVKAIGSINKQLAKKKLLVNEFIIDKNNSWSARVNHQFILTIGRKHQFERVKRFAKIYSAIEKPDRIRTIDLRYESGVAVDYSDVELSDKRKS